MSLGMERMQQGKGIQGQSSSISKREPKEEKRSDPRASPTMSCGSINPNTI